MDYSIYVINVMKPDNTPTTFGFMGDTLISSQEFESKRDNYLSKLKQHLTVSEDIWKYHTSTNFKDVVMVQDYIFLEDTIHTIKLKLFHALQLSHNDDEKARWSHQFILREDWLEKHPKIEREEKKEGEV